MATDIVPRHKARPYGDSNPYQNISNALQGAEAVGSVICEAAACENECGWSKTFIETLCMAQASLIAFAQAEAEVLKHEHWLAHALLGDYSPDAKARAERELAAQQKEVA